MNDAPQNANADKPSWFFNKIADLQLTRRAQNSLYRNGIQTIGDLAGKTTDDLLSLNNFGQKSLDDLLACLDKKKLPFPIPINPIHHQSDSLILDPSEAPATCRPTPSLPLSSIGIPQIALGPLQRSGIRTLTDLAGKSEADLKNVRYLGSKGLELIRAALDTLNLDLPFQLSDLERQHPITHVTADSDRSIQASSSQSTEDGGQQVVKLVKDYITSSCEINDDISNLLETLLQTSGLQQPNESVYTALNNLRDLLFILDSILVDSIISTRQKSAWNAIKQSLLLRHVHELENGNSRNWLNSLQKSIQRDTERGWTVFVDRSCGITYQSIGENLDPPITRESVKKIIKKVGGVVGRSPDQIFNQIQDSVRKKEQDSKLKKVDCWIKLLGRLPIQGDQIDERGSSALLEAILSQNPKQRLELYEELSIAVPDREWVIHYQWITGRNSGMGNGYWKDFECLKQCIHRHAIALGEPNLMPKQKTLPRRVGAIVQNFGGQSKVARRLGLAYQGQLVGDHGRTYWTEERLSKLLDDVNIFLSQDISLMPSYAQIYDFFAAQEDEPYAGKNPGSPIAGMTRQGKLHWTEVAACFNRVFVAGTSSSTITLAYIKAFVRDLGEHLDALTPSELYVLFQAQGISRGDKEKFSRTFDRLVDAVQSGMVKREDLQAWAKDHEVQSINELLEFGAELKAETNQSDKESRLLEQRSRQMQQEFADKPQADLISSEDLPEIDAEKALLALDKAASVIESSATDADRIEFLKAKATAKLWDACFKDESKLVSQLQAMCAETDTYSSEVRSAFLEEYEGARDLDVPSSYQFCDLRGRPRQPKLMQRLVAYRLKRDFRLLNLSGTGTGKTLSAVLAAQVCKSKRILVSCPNGVIPSWVRTFNSAYPGAEVHIKPSNWGLPQLDDGTHVVIVNHERFQNLYRQQMLEFCLGFQADLIVIDEIHQAKQRDKDSSSQRRELMDLFVFTTGNLNDQLRVLGLSATPVINNLLEGRSLIELVSQEPIDGIDKQIGLSTCMNLYQHFVVHGIRMNPGQLPRTDLILVDVDATPLLPQIVSATRSGGFHDVEQLLVGPKLDALKQCLESGKKTVIFITYIKNTLDPLCAWLNQNNYTYSVYTGGDKEAKEAGFSDSLDEFIRGSSDVLIATIQCAGTGVDGLQSVCNRAVFLQLPWTSTEFEQAIGRLDRDGTEFSSVKIHLPITDIHLPNGERWSWCRSKLDRIRSKRDIAKAAVDGEVPDEAAMITPTKASEYWLQWLKRLETEKD